MSKLPPPSDPPHRKLACNHAQAECYKEAKC